MSADRSNTPSNSVANRNPYLHYCIDVACQGSENHHRAVCSESTRAPSPAGNCPRCHRGTGAVPNPSGCARCNPERLGERLTETLAERDSLRAALARAEAERDSWKKAYSVTTDEAVLRAEAAEAKLAQLKANMLGNPPHCSSTPEESP
jgi:hypothetical protein